MKDEVKFIESPKSTYILRAKPAKLSCKVLNAKRIRFACNSKWIEESRHEIESGRDAGSQLPYLLASVQIQRQELDAKIADLGEFACQCYASSSSGTATSGGIQEELPIIKDAFLMSSGAVGFSKSETAKVRLAYIRKHFYQMPLAQRVAEGQTVQLPCGPPDGDPKPEIIWRKDDQVIGSSDVDSNLIVANDGSLIISATRLSDSGNYSCEAVNLANRRVTDPAQITVYVDGEWSPWSEWQGNCPSVPMNNEGEPPSTITAAECAVLSGEIAMLRGAPASEIARIMPKQRRQRACNNPAPLNDGAQCSGSEEEFRMCSHSCVLDGSWSPWSRWSDCNAQCQRLRSRDCTAPAPTNGGITCQGRDEEWRNCSGLPEFPHCLNSPQFPASSATAIEPHFSANLPTLVGLGFVGILLLIIAALVGALVRRKSRWRTRSADGTPTSLCKTYAALEAARDVVNGGGKSGFFLGEKGDKLYFPLNPNENDEDVRSLLMGSRPTPISNNLFAQLIPPPPPPQSMPNNGCMNQKFYTILNSSGQHSLLRTVPGNAGSLGSQRLPLRYMVENNYILRSAKSSHSQGDYSANRGMAGSRAALITTDYSSSSNASSTHGGGSGSGTMPAKLIEANTTLYKLANSNDDSNYATLYDYVASSGCGATTEESANSSSSVVDKYSTSLQTCIAELDDDDGIENVYNEERRVYDGTASLLDNNVLPNGGNKRRQKTAATVVAAQVDSDCSKIELKRSGVALTIGEGAFAEERMIFLAVSDAAVDRPFWKAEDETWLSSVIVFGLCEQNNSIYQIPTLKRPIVLSFEHCASLFPKDNWQFSVYANYDVKGTSNIWEQVCRLGDENLNTPVYAQLDRQKCHLVTDQFGRYLLVGQRRRPNVAPQKRVHLAAYCTISHDLSDKQENSKSISKPIVRSIRIYCVPEMFMAVENIRRQEEESNFDSENGISQSSSGILLAESEGFLMCSKGALCCCLEEISEGYCLQSDSCQYLEIPEEKHEWCSQNGLHFGLNLRSLGLENLQNDDSLANVEKTIISGRIVIYQKGNPTERQILSFKLDESQINNSSKSASPSSCSFMADLPQPNCKNGEEQIVSTQFQLSPSMKRILSNMLDCPPNSALLYNPNEIPSQLNMEQNWAGLAKKLGFDRYIQFFATHPGCSPASLVLDLWEACVGESERALLDLLQTLRVMGRADAVLLLEEYLTENAQEKCL